MKKSVLMGMAISLGFCISIPNIAIAQEKTKEEITAEKEEMRSILKSEKAKERQEKIAKLILENPKTCGVANIDQLSGDAKNLLKETATFNKLVPELYSRTIGETVDGVTDITVKKPTLEELTQVANTLANQLVAVAEVSNSIASASTEVSKLNPMAIGKVTKVLGYSKDAIALVGPELQMNVKVIKNLISLLNSANNN